jgi:hypothetical protein
VSRREHSGGRLATCRRVRSGRLPSDFAVWSALIVIRPPFIQHVSGLHQTQEQLPVQQLISKLAVGSDYSPNAKADSHRFGLMSQA